MKIGYARVSTGEQHLDLQIQALLAYGCDAKNIYTDKVSGTKDDRPGLDAALKSLRQGDKLVVWKLDRLGRRIVRLVALMDDLRTQGVDFVSTSQSIDTSTEMGEIIFTLFSMMAQMERTLNGDRIKAGIAARPRGKSGGRPKALTPKQVKTAQQLYDGRQHTIAEIAETLGCSPSTIKRYVVIDRKKVTV